MIVQSLDSFWVIIPAAGKGQRFNHAFPKQYTLVHGKTILEHSLALFSKLPWVKQIVLCLAPQDEHFSQLRLVQQDKIQIVPGGSSRADSVLNAIQWLDPQVQDNDWVLIHDAVRPCLHLADLTMLIQQLEHEEVGGILALPVSDTLKSFKEGILQTIDRTHLWQALTPQMFRFKKLKTALLYCQKQRFQPTDEASAIEKCGYPIRIVQAQHANPKLTYLSDLSLISHLLQLNEVIS